MCAAAFIACSPCQRPARLFFAFMPSLLVLEGTDTVFRRFPMHLQFSSKFFLLCKAGVFSCLSERPQDAFVIYKHKISSAGSELTAPIVSES